MKIVGAVEYCTEYIDEVPIELFPSLFALLQGGGIVKNDGDCIGLFSVYKFVRRWNEKLFHPADVPWDAKPTVAVAEVEDTLPNALQLR